MTDLKHLSPQSRSRRHHLRFRLFPRVSFQQDRHPAECDTKHDRAIISVGVIGTGWWAYDLRGHAVAHIISRFLRWDVALC